MRSHVWYRFLPAMFVYPMWIYIMAKRNAWWECFGTYYPLCVAMVFGSMIAGSTPLGGGVVGFPVTVLLIKFQPEQARDFSLMIQSVGMTAASFLIVYAKRDLCHVWLILWSLIGAMGGMLLGFELELDGFVVNLIFTTTIACFALGFLYRNVFVDDDSSEASEGGKAFTATDDAWKLLHLDLQSNCISTLLGEYLPLALTGCCCIFGFMGGLLTSKLGSGADMLAYMFGVFVWNTSVPKGARMPDTVLTASSVVIMAGCSIIGSLLRLLTTGISVESTHCWAACIPIVVLGAPVGSLLLTPTRTQMLRRCFYVLSLVQLVSFGILKIKDNVMAWLCVMGALLAVSLCLALHYTFSQSSPTCHADAPKLPP